MYISIYENALKMKIGDHLLMPECLDEDNTQTDKQGDDPPAANI